MMTEGVHPKPTYDKRHSQMLKAAKEPWSRNRRNKYRKKGSLISSTIFTRNHNRDNSKWNYQFINTPNRPNQPSHQAIEPTKSPSHRTNRPPENIHNISSTPLTEIPTPHEPVLSPRASRPNRGRLPGAARHHRAPQPARTEVTNKNRGANANKNKVSHRRIYTHITVTQVQNPSTSSVQQMPSGHNWFTSQAWLKTLGCWRCKNEIYVPTAEPRETKPKCPRHLHMPRQFFP